MSWRRAEAWFAAQLDERDPRSALTAIALFALAGVLFLTGVVGFTIANGRLRSSKVTISRVPFDPT